VDTLVHQAGLPQPSLAHDGYHLAMTGTRTLQSLAEGAQLRVPADKACQPPGCAGLEAAPERTGPHQLIDLHRLRQALDRDGTQGLHPDQALDQPQGRGREQDTARRGQLFHAGREVHRLPDGRVVHVQVVADGPHHLAGIEPNPEVHSQAVRASHLVTVAAGVSPVQTSILPS
jgi:hypothetical protein